MIEKYISDLEKPFNEVAGNQSQVNFAKESQFALQLLTQKDFKGKDNFLLSTAKRNPESLKNAIVNIAAVGLSLNPVSKDAYLVPRDNKICLDVSFRGLCKLAERGGGIKLVQAKIVRQEDEFELNGALKEPTHKYSPFKDRGEIIGVYCIAICDTGEVLTEVMTLSECNYIRNRTQVWIKKKAGPWRDFPEQMMLKTVVKRAAKMWPTTKSGIHIHKAIEVINQHEGIDFEKEKAEAEEKHQLEVNESIAKEKANYKKDFEERQELITEICRIAGEKCEGKTQQEKGEFLVNVIKVESFKELDRKTVKELTTVLSAVDWEDK